MPRVKHYDPQKGEWVYSDSASAGTSSGDTDGFSPSAEKVITGIRRKILAITGNLADRQRQWNKDNAYSTCRVTAVESTYIDILVSGEAFERKIRLSIAEGNENLYEIIRFSGWGFTRSSVYSTSATTKRIIDVNIEANRYKDLEVLKTVGFEFRNLVINYEVDIDASNVCTVTLFVSPDYISICETFPESLAGGLVTQLISGSYISNITTHGESLKVFTVQDSGARYYTERVEKVGNSVIKTFNMKGGF